MPRSSGADTSPLPVNADKDPKVSVLLLLQLRIELLKLKLYQRNDTCVSFSVRLEGSGDNREWFGLLGCYRDSVKSQINKRVANRLNLPKGQDKLCLIFTAHDDEWYRDTFYVTPELDLDVLVGKHKSKVSSREGIKPIQSRYWILAPKLICDIEKLIIVIV